MQTTPIVKGWKSLPLSLLRSDQSLFLLRFSNVKGNPAGDSYAPPPSTQSGVGRLQTGATLLPRKRMWEARDQERAM